MNTKTKKQESVEVDAVRKESATVCLVSDKAIILNRMSQKAQRELLQPPQKKNRAERQSTVKHNPMEEFRASPYTLSEPEAPTLLAMPGAAFKGAIAKAALDLPGATKSQIGRLTSGEGKGLVRTVPDRLRKRSHVPAYRAGGWARAADRGNGASGLLRRRDEGTAVMVRC